jgi:hypothetical protein
MGTGYVGSLVAAAMGILVGIDVGLAVVGRLLDGGFVGMLNGEG